MPSAMAWSIAVILVLTAVSVIFSWINARAGYREHGWVLLMPPRAGFDFWNYIARFRHVHSKAFFTTYDYPNYAFYYPAPAMLVLTPFYCVGHGFRYASFLLTTLCATGGVAIVIYRRLIHENLERRSAVLFLCGTLLFSWPIFFALQRGNIEAVLWIGTAFAVWLNSRGKFRAAGVLLGFLGSVKLYPLLLLALLLKRDRWRGIVWALLAFVVSTLGALWYLDPKITESATYTLAGVQAWTKTYGEVFQSSFDHSFFHLVKRMTKEHHPNYHRELRMYYLLVCPLFIAGLLRVLRLPVINQILYLCCAMVALSPTSFDYTLCTLYIPFYVLAIAITRAASFSNKVNWPTYTALLLLSFLLAPDTFFVYGTPNGMPGALKAGSLLALMMLAATRTLREQSIRAQQRAAVTRFLQLGRHKRVISESSSLSVVCI